MRRSIKRTNTKTGEKVTQAVQLGRYGIRREINLTLDEIRLQYIEKGQYWEDIEFPADATSLCSNSISEVVWKRPKEIVKSPRLIGESFSRFDVKEQNSTDNAFLAALTSVSMRHELISRLVLCDQNFAQEYCGAFLFKFWFDGRWVEVMIDDRLPTVEDRLVYASSGNPEEFWIPLIEKAYAKLLGSYEKLSQGTCSEALMILTGGLCEEFTPQTHSIEKLHAILLNAVAAKSVISCDIEKSTDVPAGLSCQHAYSLTACVSDVTDNNGKTFTLVRIRNPCSEEQEWQGAWSDKAPEWETISHRKMRELGVQDKQDGEFWMSFEDFIKHFSNIQMCHLDFERLNMTDQDLVNSWTVIQMQDSWKPRVNAGGRSSYVETFFMNPQYKLSVKADLESEDNCGTVIISLLVKGTQNRQKNDCKYGWYLYKLTEPSLEKDKTYFQKQEVVDEFFLVSSGSRRYSITSGDYIVVACTWEPNMEADFLMRVFLSNEKSDSGLNTDPNSSSKAVEKFEDCNSILETDKSILNREEKVELKKLFATLSKKTNRLFAEDCVVKLNDAVKQDFKEILPKAENKKAQTKKPKPGGFGLFTKCLMNQKNKSSSQVSSSFIDRADQTISIETVMSLVSCVDLRRDGFLDLDQFMQLWSLLQTWRKSFLQHDKDKNGVMDAFELKEALKGAGYQVDDTVYKSIVARYSSKRGDVFFDEFLMICSKLRTNMDYFNSVKGNKNSVTLAEAK
ncbi:hypothetical protein Ciccas_011777, partial [Cichlidogyrus casuarinus]